MRSLSAILLVLALFAGLAPATWALTSSAPTPRPAALALDDVAVVPAPRYLIVPVDLAEIDPENRVRGIGEIGPECDQDQLLLVVDLQQGSAAFWLYDASGYDPFGQGSYVAFGNNPLKYVDPNGLVLFAFDGTDNTPASDTNVRRIYRSYRGARLYLYGPGTRDYSGGEAGQLKSQLSGSAFGAGVEERALFAAQKLEEFLGKQQLLPEHERDMEVDIVGFSRGSAAARLFVNMTQPSLKAYGAKIRFIGVFDTVPALVNPVNKHIYGDDKAGLNFDLPEKLIGAGVAFHAMSTHESREVFRLERYSGATELWFAGVHSDVGGGYGTGEDGLSNIALNWMFQNAVASGVPVDYSPETYTTTPHNTVWHDEMDKAKWKVITDRKHRSITGARFHWSVVVDPSESRFSGQFPQKIRLDGD